MCFQKYWLQRNLLLLVSGLVPGCFFAGGYGVEKPQQPMFDIAIVCSESVDLSKFRLEEFALTFGTKQDGTKLILEFLKMAKQRGAKQVSDIRIMFALRKGAEIFRCESKVQTQNHPTIVESRKLRPGTGTTKTVSVLKPVTQYVTEYQYRCHSVSKPVTRSETYYSYEYDYYSKQSRSVPRTRTVTHYEYQNECRSEPVSRMVTRYEYQLEYQYVPPQWDYVSQTYSKWELKESEPICQPGIFSDFAPNVVGKIVGTIYLPITGPVLQN